MKKLIISAISALAGAALGASMAGKVFLCKMQKVQSMSDKHLALFLMMNQWVKIKQAGKSFSSYFEKKGYKKIAVYGMSYAGATLVEELKGTGITIAYGIDQKAESIYADMDIVSIKDNLNDVDAVVVTAITFFDEIEETLSERLDCPILSLEDVLYEI